MNTKIIIRISFLTIICMKVNKSIIVIFIIQFLNIFDLINLGLYFLFFLPIYSHRIFL